MNNLAVLDGWYLIILWSLGVFSTGIIIIVVAKWLWRRGMRK